MVTPTTLSSFENAASYSPKTRNCLLAKERPNTEERSRTVFKKYSQTTCLLECRLQELIEMFQCIPWDLVLLQNRETRLTNMYAKKAFNFNYMHFRLCKGVVSQNFKNLLSKSANSTFCEKCMGDCDLVTYKRQVDWKVRHITMP